MSLKTVRRALVPNDTERHVVFSDIDGTLVHYPTCVDALAPVWEDDYGSISGPSVYRGYSIYTDQAGRKHKVLMLPPSSTGLQGIIGMRALSSLSALRTNGYPLFLVSGARTSTVLQRLACLPLADALVSENGGRIFVHDPALPTAAKIVEDTDWRQRHTPVAGPPEQEGLAPESKEGLLWETYRKFSADGWRLDAAGYSTAFRIKLKDGQTDAELEEALAQLPELLTYSFNLGQADVYPATSGKEQAARYLIQQLGADTANCSLLCDDDNDLKLAAEVGQVYVVSKTSPSIVEAAAADPEKFWVAKSGGILATEEVLYALGDRLGAFIMG